MPAAVNKGRPIAVVRKSKTIAAVRQGGGGTPDVDAKSIQLTPVTDDADVDKASLLMEPDVTSPTGFRFRQRRITQDDILPGASSTLVKTLTSMLEIGASDTSPAFTSAPTSGGSPAIPTSAIVTDTDANTPQDVTSTPTAWSSAYSYTKSTNGQSVTWTLTEVINGTTIVRTASRTFGTLAFYGPTSSSNATIAAMSAGALEAFVEALASNVLATTRTRSIFSTALTVGQHLVIEIPTAWGTPVFKDENGFVVGATAIVSGTRTNASGGTIAFTLWDVSPIAVGNATIQRSVS